MPDLTFTPVDDPVYVHPLSEPVMYGPVPVREIAVRKPTGMDLLAIGSPVISDPTSGQPAKIDFPVAYRLVSALSGLPEKTLFKVDPAEMMDLFWKVGSFFIPGWQDLLPAMQKLKGLSSELREQPDVSLASTEAPAS